MVKSKCEELLVLVWFGCGVGFFVVVVEGKLSICLVFETPQCYIFNPLHPQGFFSN